MPRSRRRDGRRDGSARGHEAVGRSRRPDSHAGDSAVRSWLRLAGVGAVALKLLLIPLVVDPQGSDAFALPKSAVSRGLLYVLLLLSTAYMVRYAAARPPVITLGALGFVVISGLATLFAMDQTAALYGAHRRYLGLTFAIDGAVLASAIALFVRTRGDLLALGVAAAIAAFATMAYQVVQLTGSDPLRWAEPATSSLIGNNTTLGGYLSIVTSAALATALLAWGGLPLAARVIALAAISVAATLTVGTGARTAALALVPSAIFAVVVAWRAGAVKTRAVAVIGASVLIAAVSLTAGPLRDRLARVVSGEDTSALERAVIYETALKAVASRPLLGAGPDGMGSVYLAFRPPESARSESLAATQTSTHNWILHHAVGTGLLGLASFLVVTTAALIRAWRHPRVLAGGVGSVALVAYLVQGLFTINAVVNDLLFWAAVGLIAVPVGATGPRPRVLPGWLTAGRDRWLAALALALGAVAASSVTNVLEAGRAVRSSDLARAQGKLELAQRAAHVAVLRDPGRADNWNVLGLAYARRDPRRAMDAFEQAAKRAPRDPVYLLNLAAEEVLATGGRSKSASEHALRAIALDPNGPTTLRRASQILSALGRHDQAIQTAERLRDLLPEDLSALGSLTDAFEAAGRSADALVELKRSIAIDPATSKLAPRELPLDLRLRLSRLYQALGRLDEAVAVIHPPSLAAVDVACTPLHGTAFRIDRIRPLCVTVSFVTDEPLRSDGSDSSVLNPANYLLEGEPLPTGTVIQYDGAATVTLQFPAGYAPPASESAVSVKGVSNRLGQAMQPSPAMRRLP